MGLPGKRALVVVVALPIKNNHLVGYWWNPFQDFALALVLWRVLHEVFKWPAVRSSIVVKESIREDGIPTTRI